MYPARTAAIALFVLQQAAASQADSTAPVVAPPPAVAGARPAPVLSAEHALLWREISALKEDQKRYTDPAVFLPYLVTLALGVGGWVVAWKVSNQSTRDASRDKNEDRLFESLKLLAEGSQARSIGIGLIDANWTRMRWMQDAWTMVLSNQAIHLLTRAKEPDSLVEVDNLTRIFSILQRPTMGDPKWGSKSDQNQPAYQLFLPAEQIESLRLAIGKASQASDGAPGIRMSPEVLEHWQKTIVAAQNRSGV
jgi:hypothetical protein